MYAFDFTATDAATLWADLADAAAAITEGEADGIANMANVEVYRRSSLTAEDVLGLGARYVALVGGTPLTLRFNVDNVADKRYWASAYNAYNAFGAKLVQGGPRTFKASASIDF